MVFIAALLILVVLLQSSKGDGLAGSLGGGNLGSAFGVRKTADFLSRLTWWLGGSLFVLAVVYNLFFLPGQSTVDQRDSIIQNSRQSQAPTQATLPQAPATQKQENKK